MRFNIPIQLVSCDFQVCRRRTECAVLTGSQPLAEGLIALLSLHEDLTVVGEAANGEEAIALAGEKQPDLILMDLSMPVCDGVTATERIHAELPRIKIVVLTTFDDDTNITRALNVGASAYILKNIPSRQLADAIRLVIQGHTLLGPSVSPNVVPRCNSVADERATTGVDRVLTSQELDVFRLLGDRKD